MQTDVQSLRPSAMSHLQLFDLLNIHSMQKVKFLANILSLGAQMPHKFFELERLVYFDLLALPWQPSI